MPFVMIGAGIILIILFVLAVSVNKSWVNTVTVTVPDETADHLDNPDRGIYYIYDFLISDEDKDYKNISDERFGSHPDTRLALIEIDLANYAAGDISEAGLNHINEILYYASRMNTSLILRFLYDRNGKAIVTEPKAITTIGRHMEQLSPYLYEYQDSIFSLQGLFTGDWGEMHGSRYHTYEEMRYLAKKLYDVTPQDMYLSVRTPAQWRNITEYSDDLSLVQNDVFASRIGLYNDGMLGNEYDTGTYGSSSKADAGYFNAWIRSEEIAFQQELCRYVPSGGEVINPNSYNDLDQAIETLRSMHVTYLNIDYDGNVWDKWEHSVVQEDGVFNGTDGRTYMMEHLGYRYVLKNVNATVKRMKQTLTLNLTFDNVGFAPAYQDFKVKIQLVGSEHSYDFEAGVIKAMSDPSQPNNVPCFISLKDVEKGDYDIILTLVDEQGRMIKLGNGEDHGKLVIGTVEAKW